jgi:hypothetical protein
LETKTKVLDFIKNPNNIYAIIYYNDEFNLVDFKADVYEQKIVRVIAESGKSKNKKKLEILVERLRWSV